MTLRRSYPLFQHQYVHGSPFHEHPSYWSEISRCSRYNSLDDKLVSIILLIAIINMFSWDVVL
jgi:hypothetical protein